MADNIIPRILDIGIAPVAFLLMLVVGLALEWPVFSASLRPIHRLAADFMMAVVLPPAAALIAGLATVEGDLHGSAALHAHRLLERVAADGADAELARHRANRQRVAGFGHKIYRQRDPRFALLLDRVRAIPDSHGRIAVVDELLTTAGAQVSQHPNIDLALGALTYVAGFPDDIPLFAIARTAGWTAHYMEELDERPVRYRGLAR